MGAEEVEREEPTVVAEDQHQHQHQHQEQEQEQDERDAVAGLLNQTVLR